MTSLYVALALTGFGEGLISLFVPIYFWQLGFPLWRIIFFYFLISVYFTALTFLFASFLRRLSDKMMMFLSVPFAIIYFLGLSEISTYPVLFFALPAVHALNILLFNVGYHLDFSGSADKDHIGTEVGMRSLVVSLVTIGAPFIGGVIIVLFGFQYVFLTGSLVLFAAILPLLFFPKRRAAPDIGAGRVWNFLTARALLPFTASGAGYAMASMVGVIVWPLFIFFALSGIESYGGVQSAGLLASSLTAFFVGFLSDQGKRRRTLRYSALALSLVWASRAFIGGALVVVASHALGQTVDAALSVAWSSQYYKIARSLPDASAFILSREALYHITRIFFLPVLMLLAYLLRQNAFFAASFVLAALSTILYLYANKMPHTNELNHYA